MERVTRISFYIGIGISLTLFGLLLYLMVPVLIGDNSPWSELLEPEPTVYDIETSFRSHPAYVAFLERYPEAVEDLWHGNGHSTLTLQVYDPDTLNVLNLELIWNSYRNTDAHIKCIEPDADTSSYTLSGLVVAEFIADTDCV